jgi:hypothetical protein
LAAGSSFASVLVVVVAAGEGASAAPKEGRRQLVAAGLLCTSFLFDAAALGLDTAALARVGRGGALGLDTAAWQRSGRSGEKRGVELGYEAP